MTEKIYIIRVRNVFNKQFKKETPFISVSYTDENKEKHLIETFADKEKNVGVISGRLLEDLRSRLDGDGGGVILIGKN